MSSYLPAGTGAWSVGCCVRGNTVCRIESAGHASSLVSPYNEAMNQEREFDIVIAGGGMVGTSLARLLADLGTGGRPCRIALLDRVAFEPDKTPFHAQPERYDPRVSALTQASKALFSELGIWRHIADMRQCPYDEMQVWDAEGTGSIQFRAHEVHQSDLGSIVENSVISSALHQGLSEQSNLTYFAPFNLTSVKRDESDTLLISSEDGSAVRAKLLVAADGANSGIRQLAGFATREWDYGHDAIVTTVQTEKPHRATAWQRFIHTGPLAFLPLAGDGEQRHCSIVWSVVTNEAERLMGLSEAQFNDALTHAFESKLGAVRSS
ncbi:MAG: FAD-dependent monooxygenase, partial [Pseudohongiellaceae bacterium]